MNLDLYGGGPSGWSTALTYLDPTQKPLGLEFDAQACATRAAIGHLTLRCDIGSYPLAPFFGKVTGITASPPCFTADTLILTLRGLIPISAVEVGDEVLTHLGRWRKVLAVGSKVASTVIVKGQGASLHTTANHPIWSRSRATDKGALGDPAWTRAGNMKGAFWATPTRVDSIEVPPVGGRGVQFSPEFWWMVGRWLGDGWTRLRRHGRGQGNEVIICCSKAESDGLGERLRAIAPAVGPRISGVEMRWTPTEQRTTTRWTCGHNGLAEWLRTEFGVGAHGKALPPWALGLPVADRQAILDGYVSADGGVDPTTGITYTVSVSKALAVSIRLLAESLGLESRMQFVPRPPTHEIEGRIVNQSSWFRTSWRTAPTARRYTHPTDGHRWGLVRSVRQGAVERVWNLEVDEDNTYTADGIVVHNCQTFSASGKGEGRKHLDRLVAQVLDTDWSTEGLDDRTAHVLHTGRWVSTLMPEWVCFEQVRSVQPIWDAYAELLAGWGYSVWTGKLCAADYGTPQTRIRSILVASRVREVAMPAPTHAKGGAGGLAPWVSMRQALSCPPGLVGFPRLADTPSNQAGDGVVEIDGVRYRSRDLRDVDGPSGTVTEKARSWKHYPSLQPGSWADGRGGNRRIYAPDEPAPALDTQGFKMKWSGDPLPEWAGDRPATTITTDRRLSPPGRHDPKVPNSQNGHGTHNMEPWEALVLQDCDPGLPIQGTRTAQFKQIGNMIPCKLARSVLATALGCTP